MLMILLKVLKLIIGLITKFTMELKKYCSIQKYNNVESKVKKLYGKAVRGWFGIKKIIDDEDEDEPSRIDII
jgi:hypothetical protein